MRYFNRYLHYIIVAISLTGLPVTVFAQTSDSIRVIPHSLYGGFDYGSNLVYLGSTISDNLPYFTPSLTYSYRDKLYLSASASHVNSISPILAFTSLSATYNKTVNSWFDYSAGIAGYITSGSLRETLFSDFGIINLHAGFDWNILYSKLSFSEVYSGNLSSYIQVRNSHYFQTGQFWKEKAFLSFDPSISVLFGDLVKVETTTGITRLGINAPFRKYRKFFIPITTTRYTYTFGMIDTEFSLPVTLNFSRFSLQAETLYILPAHSDPEFMSPEGFALNLTAYIKLF
jgi:hypothetical protein